jgi:hypothetical protein
MKLQVFVILTWVVLLETVLPVAHAKKPKRQADQNLFLMIPVEIQHEIARLLSPDDLSHLSSASKEVGENLNDFSLRVEVFQEAPLIKKMQRLANDLDPSYTDQLENPYLIAELRHEVADCVLRVEEADEIAKSGRQPSLIVEEILGKAWSRLKDIKNNVVESFALNPVKDFVRAVQSGRVGVARHLAKTYTDELVYSETSSVNTLKEIAAGQRVSRRERVINALLDPKNSKISEQNRLELLNFLIAHSPRGGGVPKAILNLEAGRLNNEKFDEILIENGADVNSKDGTGTTVLYRAVEAKNLNLVQLLLKNGANPVKRNRPGLAWKLASEAGRFFKKLRTPGDSAVGDTPLNLAARIEDHELAIAMVEAMLEAKDLNLNIRFGNAPIHSAALLGNLDLIKLLAKKGAKLNLKNESGETAPEIAQKEGYSEIVEFLEEESHYK